MLGYLLKLTNDSSLDSVISWFITPRQSHILILIHQIKWFPVMLIGKLHKQQSQQHVPT